jgi:hypothetical protein
LRTDAELRALAHALVVAVGEMSESETLEWIAAVEFGFDEWPRLAIILATFSPPPSPSDTLAEAYRAALKERYAPGLR